MDNKNFDSKENLGHGIKGEVNTTDKNNLKYEKNNTNNKANNLRSDTNLDKE